MFFLKLNEKDQLTNNFWVAQKDTMQKLSADISGYPLPPSGTLQIIPLMPHSSMMNMKSMGHHKT